MEQNYQADLDRMALSFGASLAKHRKQANMSMAELARRCCMQRAYVWRVEQGQTLPTLRNAARLATALDITLAELVKGLDVSGLSDDKNH